MAVDHRRVDQLEALEAGMTLAGAAMSLGVCFVRASECVVFIGGLWTLKTDPSSQR